MTHLGAQRCLLLVSLAVAIAGCVADLSLPPDAKVSCASQAECPPGWQCRLSIGSCVPSDVAVGDPPKLDGDATVEPRALRSGAVAVGFKVDKELRALPLVTAKSSGDPLTAEVVAGAVARSYVATFDVPGAQTEGSYVVTARVTGADGAAQDLVAGAFAVDRTAPGEVVLTRVKVVIGPGAPEDPDGPVRFSFEGIDGAATEEGRIEVIGGGVAEPVASSLVEADRGFPELHVDVPRDGAFTAALRLVDLAGNVGPWTSAPLLPFVVSVDTVSDAIAPPAFRTRRFTSDPTKPLRVELSDLGVPATRVSVFLRVGESERTLEQAASPPTGVVAYDLDLPLSEGFAAAALRAEVGLPLEFYGPGSYTRTAAIVFDIDRTPPAIDTAKVSLSVDDDVGLVVSGAAGAVTDRLGDALRTDGPLGCLRTLAQVPLVVVPCRAEEPVIRDDGSFGPLPLAEVRAGARLFAVDPAQNVAEIVLTLPGDATKPELSELVLDPPVVKLGEPVRVRFDAGDAQGGLVRLPLVHGGGADGVHRSGALGSAGVVSSFEYELPVADPDLAGPTEVLVRVRDAAGLQAVRAAVLQVDVLAPTAHVESPADGATTTSLAGTWDDDVGVDRVEYALFDPPNGTWWNGTTFAPTETRFRATLVEGRWFAELAVPGAATAYALTVRAVDRAGRESEAVVRAVRLSPAPQAPPVGLVARSGAENEVLLDWLDGPGPAPTSWKVHFRRPGSTSWSGAASAQGPSPQVAGQRLFLLRGLAHGAWEFCVAAVRDGSESPCSVAAPGFARAWEEVAVPSTNAQQAVLVGDRIALLEVPPTGPARVLLKEGAGSWATAFTFQGGGADAKEFILVDLQPDGVVALRVPFSGAAELAVQFRQGGAWMGGAAFGATDPRPTTVCLAGKRIVFQGTNGDPGVSTSASFWASSRGGSDWSSRFRAFDAGLGTGGCAVGASQLLLDGYTLRSSDGGRTSVRIDRGSDGLHATSHWFGAGNDQFVFNRMAARDGWVSSDGGLTFAREVELPVLDDILVGPTGLFLTNRFDGKTHHRPWSGGRFVEVSLAPDRLIASSPEAVLVRDGTAVQRCNADCSVRTTETTFPFALGTQVSAALGASGEAVVSSGRLAIYRHR